MAKVTVMHKEKVVELPIRDGLGFQALCAKYPKTPIEFDCRKADCGICIIRVCDGAENLSLATPMEQDFLKAMRADPDERLACQCRILGDLCVRVETY